ncbi:uncharacterized protein LOC113315407 [Papaver somniferum]|uniref:uncharacterized protein LOC113315407 n=1 Tax=Papaver somniferum TaxID=3469 RepID=UPI000E6FFB2F|nr:uncharacterized protein LOC113315407 [Papaver somniferum]
MNSSFLFLLPKVPGAKRTEQFRPIGLSNFCFKIITRIITTRLHEVLHKVISSQQGAFIKGRNIQEKIILASELVNELDTKRRGVGIIWLKTILESARISVLVNGGPFGFFEVGRGLRQGDPVSPFYL